MNIQSEKMASSDFSKQILKHKFGDAIKSDIHELKKYIILKFLIEGKKVRNTLEFVELKQKIDYEFQENIRDSIEELGIEKVINAVGLEKVINALDEKKLDELLTLIKKRKERKN